MSAGSGVRSAGVDEAARSALASACERVDDATNDEQVDGVPVQVVARPTSTEQVAEVMRAAADHRLSVVPRGRGTKLTWGRPPEAADVVVDVSGMDQVLDHAAGDLVMVAQAGARLTDVQQTLMEAGQRLAVDETVPGSSLGGAVATATSGPGRVASGTTRDLLIGVTLVRADGVVAKSGGRVVKNVAGYDLGKLVIGSFGTLAIVTETLFRLHPVPAAQQFVRAPAATPEEAHRLAQSVLHAQVVPAAIEVDWPADGPGEVGVLLEGIAPGVAGRTTTTLGLLGGEATEQSLPPDEWGQYPWDVEARGDQRATALKLTFAISGLPEVLAATREVEAPIAIRGSAGAGVVYGAIPPSTDTGQVAAAVSRLREVCRRYGGHLVVVDAPAAVKESVDVWGPVAPVDLMRRVKEQFDPYRRLSPGRFVGGI